MIQKDFRATMTFTSEGVGASPGKSPNLPKRMKARPTAMEKHPNKGQRTCHENNPGRQLQAGARGPGSKAVHLLHGQGLAPILPAHQRRDGATLDGRFRPAAMPSTKHGGLDRPEGARQRAARSAMPTAKAERMRVPLCFSRDETYPEHTDAMKTPMELTRKTEPAWLGVTPRSRPMKGIRGAKMKRLIKVREKSKVRKRTFPNIALKGSGMGHAFSVTGVILSDWRALP